jgi:hypothetical protein
MTSIPTPPEAAINWAIGEAISSPCQKSKRGVVIYDPNLEDTSMFSPIGTGLNGPPRGGCDGSCRSRCSELAVHAEVRAIRASSYWLGRTGYLPHRLDNMHLVHVKVTNDKGPWELTAGKGPCCIGCSAQLLDVNIGRIWLYETHPDGNRWVCYTAEEFHRVTIENTKPAH